MKNFNALFSLVKRLNQDEYNVLIKLLTFHGKKSDQKSIKLIDVIKKNPNITARSANIELYQKSNNAAFTKLVYRLKITILEVILMDSSLNNKVYPERIRVNFELKKNLLQSDLLNQKGLRDDADSLCKKIITKAENYELYDIASQALLTRQKFASIRKKASELNKIQKNIEHFDSRQKSLIKCQMVYNSIMNRIANSKSKHDYLPHLLTAINTLEHEIELHKSMVKLFYLYMLKTDFYQSQENYTEADRNLKLMYEVVIKKSVYSVTQMGSTLLNLSNNYIFLKEFDLAIEYSERSKKYFFGNVINTSLADEHLFYAYYYQKNYLKSLDIINTNINNSNANNLKFNVDKWNYYFCCIKFIHGEFKSCYQLITQIDESKFENDEWKFNVKLLTLMALIEQDERESSEYLIENMTRIVKRLSRKPEFRKRYILISKVLLKLSNTSYDFTSTFESRRNYLNALAQDTSEVKWKFKDFELIPFHQWFISKVKNYS
jgi:hypothetical protein